MFFVLPADSRNAQRNEQGFAPGLQTQFNIRGSFGEEYGRFVTHILRGDLGDSQRQRDAVTDVIRETLPVTLSLILGGTIFFLLIAIPIGVLSALYPRSLLDKGLMLVVLIGASAHSVWLGLVFSYVGGVKLHWFPVGGYCDLHYQSESTSLCGGPRYWAYHMILPWLTFAFLFAALYARMIRASLLESLGEDYVRTARAKGAGEMRGKRKQVLRNSVMPVTELVGKGHGLHLAGDGLAVGALAGEQRPADVSGDRDRRLHRGCDREPGRRSALRGARPARSPADEGRRGRRLARGRTRATQAAAGARERVGYDAVSHRAQACS